MSFQKPIPTRRCINYKKVEAPFFHKVEKKLSEEMGMTVSEVHKTAIRKLYNDRQVLEMV